MKPTVVRTEMGKTAWPEGAPETKVGPRMSMSLHINTIQSTNSYIFVISMIIIPL